jgi:hypothetical protein
MNMRSSSSIFTYFLIPILMGLVVIHEQTTEAFVFTPLVSSTQRSNNASTVTTTPASTVTKTTTSTYMSNNMEELMRAASDPKLFEEYVQNQKNKKEEEEKKRKKEVLKQKKGYVPIEKWDEDRKKDNLSWEEKVQFDGQRFGNKFQQNEILKKNLKSW